MALSTPYWRPMDWTPGQVPDGAGGTRAAVDPTELIRGSDGVSTDSPQLTAEALALFPVFDATNRIDSRPVGYGPAPDPARFATWHSAHQLAWMAEYGESTTKDGFTFRHATLGDPAGDPMRNLNVVLSSDGARIITLNHLQPTDVARLPPADQRAITLHPAWVAVVADRLNLRPTVGETAAAARADAIAMVNELVARIEEKRGLTPAQAAAQLAEFNKGAASNPSQAVLWPQAFIAQLKILAAKLQGMSAFDMDGLGAALQELGDRFDRVQRFDRVTPEQDTTNILTPRYVNAVNGLDGVTNGRDTLVRVELKIYELVRLADEISRTGVYEGRPLDTPALTFVLQTFANYRAEAEAEAKTEELNQRNALMQDYGLMQGYLNATLATFDASKLSNPDQREYKTILEPSTDTVKFWRTVAMFDSSLAGGANSFHPSETGAEVVRPLADFVSGVGKPKEFFDQMAIQMSEASKRLGQDNQLMMSNISQLNREKNRHYDMATNTLNKMTGLLRSITDSGSGE